MIARVPWYVYVQRALFHVGFVRIVFVWTGPSDVPSVRRSGPEELLLRDNRRVALAGVVAGASCSPPQVRPARSTAATHILEYRAVVEHYLFTGTS